MKPIQGRHNKVQMLRILDFQETLDSIQPKLSSNRLLTLKNSQVCVECGIRGNVFVLERANKREPHISLYGVNDKEELILMTADHIIPKSLGGTGAMSNLQTMCKICNETKGNGIVKDRDPSRPTRREWNKMHNPRQSTRNQGKPQE